MVSVIRVSEGKGLRGSEKDVMALEQYDFLHPKDVAIAHGFCHVVEGTEIMYVMRQLFA
jgi:hypothetical protein